MRGMFPSTVPAPVPAPGSAHSPAHVRTAFLLCLALIAVLVSAITTQCTAATAGSTAKKTPANTKTTAKPAKPAAVPASPAPAAPQVDTLYVPDLIAPEEEQVEKGFHVEKEIILEEGPTVEMRFGDTMKPFVMAKPKEHPEFGFGLSGSFDRVDGLSIFCHQEFNGDSTLYPTVKLMEGYAFDGKHWRYRAMFEQPLFRPEFLSFGASVYLLTDTYDGEISGVVENSLTALCLKHDYRDYFEREGGLVFVKQKFLGYNTVTVQYAEDHMRSLETKSKGLFHRHSRKFRENPAVDEGKWATVAATYEYDSRSNDEYEPGTFHHRLYYELGENKDAPDVSETQYTRIAADLRSYLRLGPGQYLNVRLQGGSTVSGTLPFQREFYAGGLGTLNAFAFKEFRGDQLLLGNVEYLLHIAKRSHFIMFADVGKAWYDWDRLKDQRMEFDVGIGIGVEEGLRLCVAKDPRGDADPVWILRLQRPF